MAFCLISLGSNLGDRHQLVSRAAQLLRRDGNLVDMRCSRLFETPPIGGPSGQSVFLNAALVVQTQLRAREVLALLQRTETSLGRVRDQRWDARSIDLDLVLYGDWIGSDLKLTLPHPRLAARRFVLTPALDVAPEWREPRSGWTLQELEQHLHAAPPSMALTGGSQTLRAEICEAVEGVSRIEILRMGTISEPKSHVRGFATIYPHHGHLAEPTEPQPSPGRSWVSDFVPKSLEKDSLFAPRVIARLNPVAEPAWWPEPRHQWQNAWQWPEYQLDVVDPPQAALELVASLAAMECFVTPITTDGTWSV